MSIYHFPIDARTKRPILNSFSQNGFSYDVYSGRFDAVKDKLIGKMGIRPQSFTTPEEVIAHFSKYGVEDEVRIRVYDALFGKRYQLDAQGMRIEVETDGTESSSPLTKRVPIIDSFHIEDLVANSFFSPRSATLAARKAESQKASGSVQHKPSSKTDKSDQSTNSDMNRFGA